MTNKMLLLAPLVAGLGAVGCGDLGDVNAAVAVRYAPEGTLVVFAGDAIDLYDETLTTRTASIPAPQAGGGYSQYFNLSDDGTVAAVSDYDPNANKATIDLFSIPGRGALRRIDLGPPPSDPQQGYVPEGLALSPQGDLVYVMGGVAQTYRGVAMFDTATGAMLWSADWAILPAFSPDGGQIYVSGDQGKDLLGFDARSGASVLDAPFLASPEAMSSTADPHTLVALVGGTIELLSTYDGSATGQFEAVSKTEGLYGTPVLGLPAFRCSPQAGLCAVGVVEITGVMANPYGAPFPLLGAPRVKVWSTTGTLVQDLPMPEGVTALDMAISPDGLYVASADSQGNARVFRMSDGSQVNIRHYGGSVF